MLDDSSPDLASGLRHTLTRLYLTLRRNAPLGDISAAQGSALALLHDHGPMRMGEFADRESIRMPTATALIDGLCREGLVSREPDPTDRRAVLISITPQGVDAVDDIRSRRDDAVTRALADLSEAHRSAIAEALPALRDMQSRLENYDRK
ncbi:MarR family winged helix-turn-helix transcriptional regulator [Gordonia shandongensis]|uniref:MarR family winged helix-turn-helix transcriptional regulator n=1 Tax=Gordonia shandongensis TaxID=376351 RepID=UPI00041A8829|nr:MarR family transcriptional regulator [Gordonia shandongensis]